MILSSCWTVGNALGGIPDRLGSLVIYEECILPVQRLNHMELIFSDSLHPFRRIQPTQDLF